MFPGSKGREIDDFKVDFAVVRLRLPNEGVVFDPIMIGRRRPSGRSDVQDARHARQIAEGDVRAEIFEHLAHCCSTDEVGKATDKADGRVR